MPKALAGSAMLRRGAIFERVKATRWTGPARRAIFVLALLPLALAACGGSRSPAVANLGTTTTSTTSASSGTRLEQYAACMRSHGVLQFPEPTNNGTSLKVRIGPGTGIDPNSPQFQSARADCSGLLPDGGGLGPTLSAADRLDYLKAVACVRARGVPDFPDPTFVDGHVSFHIPSTIDPTSPVVAKAIATCRKLIPAGLPYSN